MPANTTPDDSVKELAFRTSGARKPPTLPRGRVPVEEKR
jgi:hypothetical protein